MAFEKAVKPAHLGKDAGLQDIERVGDAFDNLDTAHASAEQYGCSTSRDARMREAECSPDGAAKPIILLESNSAAEVDEAFKTPQPPEGNMHAPANLKLETELARLAKLSPLDYERSRNGAAKSLNIRKPLLDEEVAARREEAAGTNKIVVDTEPWPEPVDVAELLDEIYGVIRQFIVCEPATATAATLWVAFTWIIDHVQVAPLAVITAPEKRCGKTQLLDVIGRLSKRPLFASSISPAAVFRVIEAHGPTLLIDEADAFFGTREELRGIVNSGHTRTSAYVVRCVGDKVFEPKRFSTWGAKALSGIGKLPSTVMDRAIVLPLRRKLPSEKVQRLRRADSGLFETLAGKLARFSEDHGITIGRSCPELPEALDDRAQDNWEPLLAIAYFAGGNWPKEARRAALTISGGKEKDRSLGEQLLQAIKDVFERDGLDKISREQLVKRLIADEEGPWATWNKGKPMSPAQLRQSLATYEIKTKKIRTSNSKTEQGFETAQFVDVWERYLHDE
jgi:putative DNA primase/helicase